MNENAVSKFVYDNSEQFVNKHLNPKGDFYLKPQYTLDYGGQVDWAVFDETTDKIIGLIECKGEPSLTDFVRGLGQVNQYYRSMIHKRNKGMFMDDAKTLYVAGKKTLKKIRHWDLMHYDKGDNLVLIDDEVTEGASLPTEEYALYRKKDIDRIMKVKSDSLLLSGLPFVRDVRIYELYMGLMALYNDNKDMIIGGGSPNKNRVIERVLQRYMTVNSSNARNVGIALRDMGLLDEYNIPTEYGMKLLKSKYVDFVKSIVFNRYNGVIINVITAMLNISSSKGVDWKNYTVTQSDIKKEVINMYGGVKVKNLTDDSDTKSNYIGTCLLILSKDLGAVEMSKIKKINNYKFKYLPLKELAMTKEINEGIINSVPQPLVDYMTDLGYTNWIHS